MRLMTFRYAGQDHAGVVTPGGVVPVLEINAKHGLRTPNSLLEIIREEIRELPTSRVAPIPLSDIEPRLPYEVPPKIWCIGLNYKSHAEDISAVQPEEPGSFMKPASCMFQPGGRIVLPPPEVSDDVDAEGELGVIIGRSCRFVPMEPISVPRSFVRVRPHYRCWPSRKRYANNLPRAAISTSNQPNGFDQEP